MIKFIGDDNDSSIIGTECPMRNESDDNTGPVNNQNIDIQYFQYLYDSTFAL